MDQNTQHTSSDDPAMNGDDELAKTLSGGLQFEETPVKNDGDDPLAGSDDSSSHVSTTNDSETESSGDDTPPSLSSLPAPSDFSMDNTSDDKSDDDDKADDSSSAPAASSDLEKLKTSALDDLRPLVGKLNLSPEEKFDTLLLIIRSTDDQSLLGQAHQAAKEITDDTKRAQALLDVIKEVDYFNSKK